jgi:hypothetical protein
MCNNVPKIFSSWFSCLFHLLYHCIQIYGEHFQDIQKSLRHISALQNTHWEMPLYMMPLKYRRSRCEAHDKIYGLLILFLLVELLEGLHLFSCTILQNSTKYCLSLFIVLKIVIYSEICCFQYFVSHCRSLRGTFVWFPGYHVHEIF